MLSRKIGHDERLCVAFVARSDDSMYCKCEMLFLGMGASEGKCTRDVVFDNCGGEVTEV